MTPKTQTAQEMVQFWTMAYYCLEKGRMQFNSVRNDIALTDFFIIQWTHLGCPNISLDLQKRFAQDVPWRRQLIRFQIN